MSSALPVVRKEENGLTISELSLIEGVDERKIKRWLVKFNVGVAILKDALTLNGEFGGNLDKACALLNEHEGDIEVVRKIYEIRSDIEEISLVKISLLMKTFGNSEVSDIVDAVHEVHEITGRKFIGSAFDALLSLVNEYDGKVFWLEHLMDLFRERYGVFVSGEDKYDD